MAAIKIRYDQVEHYTLINGLSLEEVLYIN